MKIHFIGMLWILIAIGLGTGFGILIKNTSKPGKPITMKMGGFTTLMNKGDTGYLPPIEFKDRILLHLMVTDSAVWMGSFAHLTSDSAEIENGAYKILITRKQEPKKGAWLSIGKSNWLDDHLTNPELYKRLGIQLPEKE